MCQNKHIFIYNKRQPNINSSVMIATWLCSYLKINKWAWLMYVINENIELTLKKVSLHSDAGKLNWSPTRDIFFFWAGESLVLSNLKIFASLISVPSILTYRTRKFWRCLSLALLTMKFLKKVIIWHFQYSYPNRFYPLASVEVAKPQAIPLTGL